MEVENYPQTSGIAELAVKSSSPFENLGKAGVQQNHFSRQAGIARQTQNEILEVASVHEKATISELKEILIQLVTDRYEKASRQLVELN
jgi:hypothetical protein